MTTDLITVSDKVDTEEKIYAIWDRLGFHDTDTFKKFYTNRIEFGITDPEELELLAPENVDLGLFWRMCDDNYKYSICGADAPTVNHQNFLNWHFGTLMNMTYAVKFGLMTKPAFKVMEIGPGYGALLPELNFHDRIRYVGVDVYPRIENVIKSDGFTIPEEAITDDIYCVIASNVMQHFSIEQRRGYYRQIGKILRTNKFGGGFFSFTNCQVRSTIPKIRFEDKHYICHMGQYTEIQANDVIIDELKAERFHVAMQNYRADGELGFICETH